MTNHPSGTVTFLFTDIEGSTQLWEHHPEAMRTAYARHESILRAAVAMHNGYAYKMIGDAFQIALRSCGTIPLGNERVIRIRNTLQISELMVSAAVAGELDGRSEVQISQTSEPLLTEAGCLTRW